MNSPLTNLALDAIKENRMTFDVEGFGQVGISNLTAFVPFDGFKFPSDLALNEVSEGRLQNHGSDHKPERITRVR